ncbi:MAG: transporter substrate-binding domain-containing protein, partial [Spirochaetales bacterium]|nr:transporter substrate-binding domain-containing protein [Spirochaetales bacterium]
MSGIRTRRLGLILLVAIATAACSAPAGDSRAASVEAAGRSSAIDRILESGTLRVGTTGDWQPMTYLDPETDAYEGYYIDIIRDLAADMGVEIEWVPTTWQDKVAGIAAGRYDITTGASYNMGRARQGAFTLPIATVGTVPLTLRQNAGRFTSWESIDDAAVRVAVTLGTTQDQQAQLFFPNAELV